MNFKTKYPGLHVIFFQNRISVLLLISFFLFLPLSYAQNANSHYFYMSGISRESGLSHSHVKTIFKDSRGFLWFGTYDGLNLYDGNTCRRYLYDKTEGSQYHNKIVHCIYEDNQGYLWIGTSGIDVFRYDHINDAFNVYSLPVESDLSNFASLHIYKIVQDKNEILWFGTTHGLYFLNPGSDIIKPYLPWNDNFSFEIETLLSDHKGDLWLGTKGQGLYVIENGDVKIVLKDFVSNFITDIHIEKNGDLWIASAGDGLFYYSPTRGKQYQYLVNYSPSGALPNLVNKILPGENSKIYLATYGGLFVFDKEKESFADFSSNVSFPRFPQNLAFNALFLDDQNVLWAATQALGVYKYYLYHDAFSHVVPFPNKPGHPGNTIHSVLEGNENQLLLGSESGLIIKDKTSGQVRRLVPQGFNNQQFVITSLCRISTDSVLIGSWNHGLWVYHLEKEQFTQPTKSLSVFKNAQIFDVLQDRNNNIWLGLHEKGLLKLNRRLEVVTQFINTDPENLISGTSVRKILQDNSGKLWIGHLSFGIDIFDPETREFQNVINDYLGESRISNNDIMSLMEDSNGNIWIGTNGGGVNLYLTDSDDFVQLTEKDGLINDVIFSIMEDSTGNIWLQTNRGITRLNYYSDSSIPIPLARNFDIEDGLPNTDFLFSTSYKGEDGKFYFPSRQGLICFYPDMLSKSDKAPDIAITQIEINNKPFTEFINDIRLHPDVRNATYVESLVLKHFLNRVSIEFAALDFFKPSENQYIVKLEGFDQDWIALGNNPRVSYINLPHGKYTLHIKAGNSHNVWNETGISLQIIIQPPWWLTWWAYVLYVIVILGFLILTRFLIIRKERKRARNKIERLKMEKDRELDKFKLDFFTKITHEIRTPITLIMGPIERMMQKKRDDIEDQKYFQLLKSNSEKLYQLTNEILDLRKIDEGKFSIHKITEDLVPFLKGIKERFVPFAESKNIALEFESNCKSIYWEFDNSAIDRIVSNLVSNAIKFTEQGGKVQIRCNLTQIEDQPDQIILEVIDTGKGIENDELKEIFKPFYQTRSAVKHVIPGTGLGLALVKELTEMHQGRIEVVSQVGKGSIFRLHFLNHLAQLKAAPDPGENNEKKPILAAAPQGGKKETSQAKRERILVVEDNKELNDFMMTVLGEYYQVVSCFNGVDGYNKTLELIPDLILSDVMMPEMNGIEMCQKIKKEPLTCHIPVMMLTVMSNEENQISGFEAGADDYIAKPFNTSILLMKVRNILTLKNNLRTQFAKTFLVEPMENSADSLDPLVEKMVVFIEQNLDDPELNIQRLQREIGIGRSQLFLKIKNITGLTVSELIQGVRLKKAYGFLSTGQYTVSETAYMVGFKNLSHFTRLFKNHFGKVPSDVIKN
jgi:signal transduction histidine kinase/ligand-binding sensor domain-containing protein/DNA-binding response OmpR family regulator